MSKLEARLVDSSHAGPYLAPADAAVLAAAVKKARLRAVHVDLKHAHDKQQVLDAVARALKFPEWFGHNWDALEECLTDLSWLEAPGYVVQFDHCEEFARHSPREFATAIEIFESVAEYWDERDKPFWTLFGGIDAPVAGIKPLAE